MDKTLEELEDERIRWSLETFTHATSQSSLEKLKGEISEVEEILPYGPSDHLAEEYADCIMCLFDSAGRAGVTVDAIRRAFQIKLAKNKARKWAKNPDNTYSHVK